MLDHAFRRRIGKTAFPTRAGKKSPVPAVRKIRRLLLSWYPPRPLLDDKASYVKEEERAALAKEVFFCSSLHAFFISIVSCNLISRSTIEHNQLHNDVLGVRFDFGRIAEVSVGSCVIISFLSFRFVSASGTGSLILCLFRFVSASGTGSLTLCLIRFVSAS